VLDHEGNVVLVAVQIFLQAERHLLGVDGEYGHSFIQQTLEELFLLEDLKFY
jgi:hypothetical protein